MDILYQTVSHSPFDMEVFHVLSFFPNIPFKSEKTAVKNCPRRIASRLVLWTNREVAKFKTTIIQVLLNDV
jgi:hypothetical protein